MGEVELRRINCSTKSFARCSKNIFEFLKWLRYGNPIYALPSVICQCLTDTTFVSYSFKLCIKVSLWFSSFNFMCACAIWQRGTFSIIPNLFLFTIWSCCLKWESGLFHYFFYHLHPIYVRMAWVHQIHSLYCIRNVYILFARFLNF